jgi:large subunit ribosomal protein L10
MAKKKTAKTRTKKISERKVKFLAELKDLEKKYNTILIASIKNLPDRQFQAIKKEMRGKAEIKVAKRKMALMALENNDLEGLKKFILENTKLIFSDEDPFQLSMTLGEKRNAVKAKTGQIADEDIWAEAGPTDLVPGPAISELNAAKIKFAIEDGKIAIKIKSLIVKKGDVITEEKSGIMSKLDIKPFYVGLVPIAAYDKRENKVYNNVKIDRKETLEGLKIQGGKAVAFAIKIGYACKDTISFLLAKAKSQNDALAKLIKSEEQK